MAISSFKPASKELLVVDTGLADRSDDVLAAIRKLTPKNRFSTSSIRMFTRITPVETMLSQGRQTYTGANVTANLTDVKLGAQIFAHDNVLQRMSAPTGKQASMPFGFLADTDIFRRQKQMSFNGEPIEICTSRTLTPTATAWCSSAGRM